MNYSEKLKEIERQKKYCDTQAEQAISKYNNEQASKGWKCMVEAYNIALQILKQEGDWFPEEKEKTYKNDILESVKDKSIEELEHMIKLEEEARYNIEDYHQRILSRIMIDAYKTKIMWIEEAQEVTQ